MPRKNLKKELLPSYIRLRTTPDMRKMARRLVVMKGGAMEIEKTAKELSTAEDSQVLLRKLKFFCHENAREADETIALLEGVRMKLKKYLRSM